VRVVTDSTSDIPDEVASEFEIAVVPCQVMLGQRRYRDGIDLSPEEFFGLLAKSEERLRTSGPTVNDFVDAYRRLLHEEGASKILSIHVASTLSGTLNSAWAAIQTLTEPGRVELIDSGKVSMGTGWVAVEAARVARQGATFEEVAAVARDAMQRTRVVAMIDTLENLYEGGRISVLSAALGSALQIKPLLDIRDGEVLVWGKVRTRARALDSLVARVRGWGQLERVAVLHAGAPELLSELVGRLEEILPGQEMMLAPAGSALTSHLGLGAVGVCALMAPRE
jgi:DegV family protein with EDD domain